MFGQAGGPVVVPGGRRVPLPGVVVRVVGMVGLAGQPGFGRAWSRSMTLVNTGVQGHRLCRGGEESEAESLGSHLRVSPVRASMGIQARRSSASCTISSQIRFLRGLVEGEVAQAGGAGVSDAVFATRRSAVTQFQGGELAAFCVGGEAGEPVRHR